MDPLPGYRTQYAITRIEFTFPIVAPNVLEID